MPYPKCSWRVKRAAAFAAFVVPTLIRAAAPAIDLEDPAARARLPEFKVIPAAQPNELTPALPVPAEQFTGWTRSQGDNGARRYSALKQIDRTNVRQLEVAWTYHSQDGATNVQCTPIIVDGVLFAPTPGRAVIALDAATGRELWRFKLEPVTRIALEDAPARRGLIYWPGDAQHSRRILFGCGNWIYALDPKAGAPITEFGEKGRTPLPTGATVSGAIFRHVLVTAGLYGDAYGYDVRTGKNLWRFRSIPKGDEFGAETWRGVDERQIGANGWGGLSLDEQRGIAYVAFGAPRPDMDGTNRIGDNLFSDCVVALDVLSGRRLWHFQNIRHDIWDLDTCAPPNLVTIVREGRRIDAVSAVSKSGILVLLDRVSGKPIFPFRLRRAPVSKLPGERTAPYQPDPELPEPVSRMEFDPAEITTRTPTAHEVVKKQVERSSYGFFVPFEEGKPNLFIGSRGGMEWSGAAVDVPTGRLYVTSNRWVSKITVITNDERERDPRQPPTAGEKLYQLHCLACHGPKREGTAMVPPLLSLKNRTNDAEVKTLLKTGRGQMPPNLLLNEAETADLLDYLFRRNQPLASAGSSAKAGTRPRTHYTFNGFQFLVDDEGYPGIQPPWGLLNCYDLSTGKIIWRVPLGEIEELTRRGVPKTGSQNLGGASVTAGGLVFCAGTADQRLRAFDVDTGEELWSARLPFAGSAPPAFYEVNGREYVVITATGGGRVGGPAGDAYVAFALPAANGSGKRVAGQQP